MDTIMITINEALQQPITIHWWNFGSKTLDYKGTYEGYLNKRNITFTEITHPFNNETKGLRFKISTSSTTCTYDNYDYDYERCFFEAIKIFLSMMGDRSMISTNRWDLKVNWR